MTYFLYPEVDNRFKTTEEDHAVHHGLELSVYIPFLLKLRKLDMVFDKHRKVLGVFQ